MTTYLTPDIGKACQPLIPLITIEDNKDAGHRATGLAAQQYNGTNQGFGGVPLIHRKDEQTPCSAEQL